MSTSRQNDVPESNFREDQIIHRLQRSTKSVLIGIGDDCAQLADGQLICSDTLVEGVHFDLAYCSAADVAWKSVAVNMSDVAAMGGRPSYALLNLSLPKDHAGPWADEFADAFLEAVRFYDAELIGGDTTASPSGVFVSITVIGRSDPTHTKRRSTAHHDDHIFVTGPLGNSRAGLSLLTQGSNAFPTLLNAHRRPRAKVEEGCFLATDQGVRAMMDLSDGLAMDLRRLTSASGCSARIDLSHLPVHEEFVQWAAGAGRNPAVEAALGGEDYELLVTISPEYSEKICREFEKQFGDHLTKIGTITPPGPIVFVENGSELPLPIGESFSHF